MDQNQILLENSRKLSEAVLAMQQGGVGASSDRETQLMIQNKQLEEQLRKSDALRKESQLAVQQLKEEFDMLTRDIMVDAMQGPGA
jgi:hypothetical protein